MEPCVTVRALGKTPYEPTWRAMQRFTERRDSNSRDEIWLTEHPALFTLGQAGRPEHLLQPGGTPVIRSDRGGQITYHGPGQLIIYTLLDLRRAGFGVRSLVSRLEQAVIALLHDYGIPADSRPDAPGVYVEQRKIAALGLRIRQGCSYHGVSLNVAMDLTPFSQIDPCGHPGLQVTQLADFGIGDSLPEVGRKLLPHLLHALGYTGPINETGEPYRSTA